MAKDEKKQQTRQTEEMSESRGIQTQGSDAPDTVDLGRLAEVDTEEERRLLEQQRQLQEEQARRQIDRGVEQAVTELERAQEDARPGFQAERDRIAAEERRNLDNQALYAELRGDRGGIGQAQYGAIQNTAAVNQAQVNRAQQQLASDTARQIADLRAKGEFDKADALLRLGQSHLAQLMELARWAKETNLSIAEFNTELSRWEAEYAWRAHQFNVETEMSEARRRDEQSRWEKEYTWRMHQFDVESELDLARLRGSFPDGTPTYQALQDERKRLGEAARALLAAGLTLTPEQLAALGWTEGQYEEYIAGRSIPGSGGSGGSRETKEKGGSGAPYQLVAGWVEAIRKSTDLSRTFEEMKRSAWYDRMSREQREWISQTVKEKIH